MSPTATEAPSVSNGREPLVACPNGQGFSVYSPSNSQAAFFVSGTKQRPHCNCPVFRSLQHQPGFRCDHIKAVEIQLPDEPQNPVPNAYDQQERQAIQDEGGYPSQEPPATMTLKRSVSPDGRIDSLSIEMSQPLNGYPVGQALSLLEIQEGIAGEFLQRRNGRAQPSNPPDNGGNGHQNGNGGNGNGGNGNGATPAQILDVGGMQTRYGFRTFLTVQANGQALRLFGSRKQLAEQLTAAGYGNLSNRLDPGTALNVPCRIVTRQSEDGRYVNVEQLLPPSNGNGNGGGRYRR